MNDDIKTTDQPADDEILEMINAALDTALQGDRREAENMLLDLFVHGPRTEAADQSMDHRTWSETGAEWDHDQALVQEPTDAEVLAALNAFHGNEEGDLGVYYAHEVAKARAVLSAARAARRDEEKR